MHISSEGEQACRINQADSKAAPAFFPLRLSSCRRQDGAPARKGREDDRGQCKTSRGAGREGWITQEGHVEGRACNTGLVVACEGERWSPMSGREEAARCGSPRPVPPSLALPTRALPGQTPVCSGAGPALRGPVGTTGAARMEVGGARKWSPREGRWAVNPPDGRVHHSPITAPSQPHRPIAASWYRGTVALYCGVVVASSWHRCGIVVVLSWYRRGTSLHIVASWPHHPTEVCSHFMPHDMTL